MSAEEPEIDNPDPIHWSPRRGLVGGDASMAVHLLAIVGAAAIGAVAVGALAIGVLAIGQLSVGRARFKDVRIGRLEVGDLLVRRRAGRAF